MSHNDNTPSVRPLAEESDISSRVWVGGEGSLLDQLEGRERDDIGDCKNCNKTNAARARLYMAVCRSAPNISNVTCHNSTPVSCPAL